jgi:hypothetical protein
LLVVIGLFSLFFISRGGGEDRDIYYGTKANNFANALIKYSKDGFNFKEEILYCCEGNEVNCNSVLEFVESKSNLIDGKIKFELECVYFGDYSFGECVDGLASESIILQSGDMIRVILCRK